MEKYLVKFLLNLHDFNLESEIWDVFTGRPFAVAGSSCETDDSEQYVPEFQSHHHAATSGMSSRNVEINRWNSRPQ